MTSSLAQLTVRAEQHRVAEVGSALDMCVGRIAEASDAGSLALGVVCAEVLKPGVIGRWPWRVGRVFGPRWDGRQAALDVWLNSCAGEQEAWVLAGDRGDSGDEGGEQELKHDRQQGK